MHSLPGALSSSDRRISVRRYGNQINVILTIPEKYSDAIKGVEVSSIENGPLGFQFGIMLDPEVALDLATTLTFYANGLDK